MATAASLGVLILGTSAPAPGALRRPSHCSDRGFLMPCSPSTRSARRRFRRWRSSGHRRLARWRGPARLYVTSSAPYARAVAPTGCGRRGDSDEEAGLMSGVVRFARANAIAAVALFVALGGVSYAVVGSGFVGHDGQVHACVASRSGSVRLVRDGVRCRRGEVLVSWNQRGPVGVGQPGTPGVKGSQGRPESTGWA